MDSNCEEHWMYVLWLKLGVPISWVVAHYLALSHSEPGCGSGGQVCMHMCTPLVRAGCARALYLREQRMCLPIARANGAACMLAGCSHDTISSSPPLPPIKSERLGNSDLNNDRIIEKNMVFQSSESYTNYLEFNMIRRKIAFFFFGIVTTKRYRIDNYKYYNYCSIYNW